jgi:TrmH family RNA methyltransferase
VSEQQSSENKFRKDRQDKSRDNSSFRDRRSPSASEDNSKETAPWLKSRSPRPNDRDNNRGDRRDGGKRFDKRDGDRKFGDKKFGDKKFSDRRDGGKRFDKRDGDRKFGDRDRKFGDRKFGDRPSDAPRTEIHEKKPAWMNRILALHTEKGREKDGKFLAEGIHCVEEILQHHQDLIADLFYQSDLEGSEIVNKMQAAGKHIHAISEDEMTTLSTTNSPQGVFAVCFSESQRPDWNKARMVTLVDRVQDPGNLGAIFRTSLGFEMDAVILGSGTVNPFNPKVVRGSSGTFLRQAFEQKVDLAERIQFLRSKGFTIIATSSHTPITLQNMPHIKKKVAFLVGNEGVGADSKYLDMADVVLRISTHPQLESLNVAVAHGILANHIYSWQQTKN